MKEIPFNTGWVIVLVQEVAKELASDRKTPLRDEWWKRPAIGRPLRDFAPALRKDEDNKIYCSVYYC